MAKLGSKTYKAMDLASDELYIEIRVEKMVEFHIRFFIAKALIWLLRRAIHPCKVEIKEYEQSGVKGKK